MALMLGYRQCCYQDQTFQDQDQDQDLGTWPLPTKLTQRLKDIEIPIPSYQTYIR